MIYDNCSLINTNIKNWKARYSTKQKDNIAKFKILIPIWETRSVGLAEHKLKNQNEVEILYINKQGKRVFPHVYTITREKAFKYPTMTLRNGLILRIIPIRDMKKKKD